MEQVKNIDIDINIENSIIKFEHDSDKTGPEKIKKKLAESGYPEKRKYPALFMSIALYRCKASEPADIL